MIFKIVGQRTFVVSLENGEREIRREYSKILVRVDGRKDSSIPDSLILHILRYRLARMARRLGFIEHKNRIIGFVANDESVQRALDEFHLPIA